MTNQHEDMFHKIKASRDKHIAKHGHGMVADRAHLEEMLKEPDLPNFVRHHMQLAHNRLIQIERMEAHEKAMREPKP